MTENKISVGTKIPETTALQLKSVLNHYRRTFAGQLRLWIERDHRRISREVK